MWHRAARWFIDEELFVSLFNMLSVSASGIIGSKRTDEFMVENMAHSGTDADTRLVNRIAPTK